jgi:hypothetical protein
MNFLQAENLKSFKFHEVGGGRHKQKFLFNLSLPR